MELELKRIARKAAYTIGRLYIDGAYFCDTLEDTDRDDNRNGVFDGGERKVYAQTAIPNGEYEITMNVVSAKFSAKTSYSSWWKSGKLPRLLNVPHFDGILIHAGNTAADSAGCILVGRNTVVGRLTNSMGICKKLYPLLKSASNKGERITIKVH